MTRNRKIGGFTLIEIMVGMVIGLLASIVMFQVFAFSERQKRTTTGVSDAQANGAIALRLIERDMQMAGWGAETQTFGTCDTVFSYLDTGGGTPGPIPGLDSLTASAIIVDGGSGPDSITASYFDGPANLNFKFALTTLTAPQATPEEKLRVASTYGCTTGNVILVKDPGNRGNCTVMQISNVDTPNLELFHDPTPTPTLNPPATYMATHSWPKYSTQAYVQCLPLPISFRGLFFRTYQTDGSNLALVESIGGGSTTLEIAADIVDLQAEYGIAAAGGQDVESWVPATGIWANPLSTASLARIKAVRIAIVGRGEFEKPDDAGTCTATTSTMVATWSSWASFDPARFTGAPAGCYRYKVFETIVPLRNLIWAKL